MQRCLASGINDLEVCYTWSGCRGVVVIIWPFRQTNTITSAAQKTQHRSKPRLFKHSPKPQYSEKLMVQFETKATYILLGKKFSWIWNRKNHSRVVRSVLKSASQLTRGKSRSFQAWRLKQAKKKQKGTMVKKTSKVFEKFRQVSC